MQTAKDQYNIFYIGDKEFTLIVNLTVKTFVPKETPYKISQVGR